MSKNYQTTEEQYQAALAKSKDRPRPAWSLDSIEYISKNNSILMKLPHGVGLIFPVTLVNEFQDVSSSNLKKMYLSPSGETLCLDEEDIHISTYGLIRDIFEQIPDHLIASKFGKIGGSRSTAVKRASSVKNGKLGGRPKKILSDLAKKEHA